MGVEKVVRQVGLGILRLVLSVFFPPPSNHSSFDFNFVSGCCLLEE
jgi:hypothetical protein